MASCKSSVWRRRNTTPSGNGILTILTWQKTGRLHHGCRWYGDNPVHHERMPEENGPHVDRFQKIRAKSGLPVFHFFQFSTLRAFSNFFFSFFLFVFMCSSMFFLPFCFSVFALFSVFIFSIVFLLFLIFLFSVFPFFLCGYVSIMSKHLSFDW